LLFSGSSKHFFLFVIASYNATSGSSCNGPL
jgi:hypothetical protein